MAQIPIEIEPYVGVYVPFADLVSDVVDGVGVTVKHKEALTLGGRLTFGLGALGVEGNFVYAFTDVRAKTDGEADEWSGAVWVADARAVWELSPGPIGLHFNAGIALIGRGGDFYDSFEIDGGKTDVGGALGAGIRVRLPGILAIRSDADLYLYSTQLTGTVPGVAEPVTLEAKFQTDLVLSAGLVLSL
jgi:hypothetical protein